MMITKLRIIIFLSFTFTIPVHGHDALAELASHMPKCSLQCFAKELPLSPCASNMTSACMCNSLALNAAIGSCAKKSCAVYELLQTKNITNNGCGVPVRDKGLNFSVIAISGLVVAAAAFLLRMAASLGKRGRQLSWDDAAMAIVLILAIPPVVFAPLLVKNGLGRDMWTLQPDEITNVLKYYFFGEIFYVVALGISKISILCFYLRVFPSRRFRNLTYGVMGLSLAYTIAFFFATLFQCAPISQAWTQWDGLHNGTCNDIHLLGWSAAAINIALDVLIIVLPLKHLAGLQMGLSKKLMVISMFSLGIFVIVVSVIRLESLIYFANTQNVTWDYFEAGYWSLIEVDVSIICGCMPAHRLLFAKAWPSIKSTFDTSKFTSGASGSVFHSKFGEGEELRLEIPSKSTKIAIKPMTGDEGYFIPLVDMEHRKPFNC